MDQTAKSESPDQTRGNKRSPRGGGDSQDTHCPMSAMPSSTATTNGVMPELKKSGRKSSKAAVAADWMPLSLDDRTSQKLLWLSEGGSKVSRMSEEVCPVLDRPERYEHSPQVLCKEGLLGCRGYWEVDYEGWVVIGVVCESAGRKAKDGPCGLGENELSWGIGWAGSCYHSWHNGENVEIQGSLCTTFGIYLDQPAGILCFYQVEEKEGGAKEVRLLHKYKTNTKEKMFPGFWVGRKSFCWIQKKDQ
ncbi:stonustoxin subunit beta isoform X2 [Astyanax mexicanus]|uniref:stonustoxin subunit beta isoform X2 n=1 Tax=Astyanax mexicanus TaxID=7994 RepID=UPI0020CB652D|nr:stonustoxin subunit beta isoform X2 [Astyanax mexicanus]